MNILDIIIISVLCFFLIKGIIRGLVREIASLAGVILGIILGIRLQAPLSSILAGYLPLGGYLSIVSFTVVFFLTIIVCNLIGWGIRVLIKKGALSGVDRALGGGFAILKGIIIIYLALILITFFLPGKVPVISKSRIAPWIIRSYQTMVRIIPYDTTKRIKERWDRAKKEWIKKDDKGSR